MPSIQRRSAKCSSPRIDRRWKPHPHHWREHHVLCQCAAAGTAAIHRFGIFARRNAVGISLRRRLGILPAGLYRGVEGVAGGRSAGSAGRCAALPRFGDSQPIRLSGRAPSDSRHSLLSGRFAKEDWQGFFQSRLRRRSTISDMLPTRSMPARRSFRGFMPTNSAMR